MTLSVRMADHGFTRAISLCVVPYLRKLWPVVVEGLKAGDRTTTMRQASCAMNAYQSSCACTLSEPIERPGAPARHRAYLIKVRNHFIKFGSHLLLIARWRKVAPTRGQPSAFVHASL